MRQLARNLAIEERLKNVSFLVHDRDAKFSGSFEELIRSDGVRVIKTPVRTPKANAIAERWARTVRNECLAARRCRRCWRGRCTRRPAATSSGFPNR